MNTLATTIFIIAIIHIFLSGYFNNIANRYSKDSNLNSLFHLLGEIEIVFGLWAGVYFVISIFITGLTHTLEKFNSLSFTEPLFVFVIMIISSSKPVIFIANKLILFLSHKTPIHKNIALYFSILTIGPLFGSFITEPAAMTVSAILLLKYFLKHTNNTIFKYTTFALLLVNISIGGVLTPYAAPPVIMVAKTWNWSLAFMLQNFALKSILSVLITTSVASLLFKKELMRISLSNISNDNQIFKTSTLIIHAIFLFLIVATNHYSVVFLGIFLFYLGYTKISTQINFELKIKEALLVAFFLSGLIVLGNEQKWWVEKVLQSLSGSKLYLVSIALTSFIDNAALTYLGSLYSDILDKDKFNLVAGAVVGGGLTIMANAPNLAGLSILAESLDKKGLSPIKLFLFALIPTIIVGIIFIF